MLQVDMAEKSLVEPRASRRVQMQPGWGAGFREGTLGPAGAEPGVTGKGTGLPSPRWLALSRLREPSSWLPW